jgi:hypothetical protein
MKLFCDKLNKSPFISIHCKQQMAPDPLFLLNHGTARISKQQAAVGVIMKWKSEEEQELAQSARELQDI